AQAERTDLDALQRIDGLDHVEHGDLLGRPEQYRSAVGSALGVNQASTGELPEDLGEVARRNLRGLGQLGDGDRVVVLAGQLDHQAERVLRRLRKHDDTLPILDIEVQNYLWQGPPRVGRETTGSRLGTGGNRSAGGCHRPRVAQPGALR